MSTDAVHWAKRQQVGCPGRKAVLLALADRADEEWSTGIAHELIAEEAELSVRMVIRHIKKLEADGVIAVTRPPGRKCRYVLLNVTRDKSSPVTHVTRDTNYRETRKSVTPDIMSPVTQIAVPREEMDVTPDIMSPVTSPLRPSPTPPPKHPKVPPPKSPPTGGQKVPPSGLGSAFAELWAAYPHSNVTSRRGSKAVALKAFEKRVRTGVDPTAIVGAARLYAASDDVKRVGPDGRDFVPGLVPWLNGAKYEPWLPEPIPDAKWREALAYHQRNPTWWAEAGHRKFGPPPGQPGCRVPEHLLAEVVA